MNPQVKANNRNHRLRSPRVPSVLPRFDHVSEALTKGIFLFDQGFFIEYPHRYRFQKKPLILQYHICFSTPVL
jgi:hypothetical protein